jgi:hypothetical protein
METALEPGCRVAASIAGCVYTERRHRSGARPRGHVLESPDINSPHTRHGGGIPRWLELIIALTALITSVSSIAIAVHHGRVMEKLVQANSLPYMAGGFSDETPAGEDVLSLDLLNHGVGPAHEVSLRVKVDGQYVKSLQALISASLGAEQGARAREALQAQFLRNGVKSRFIPGGQQQLVFRIAKTAANSQFWDLLDKQSARWDVEFCYCSIFQECWWVRGKWSEPEPVKRCGRDESREFFP